MDAEGNAAAPAKITVRIGKNRAGLTYSDMEGDPAHYAAVCLCRAASCKASASEIVRFSARRRP
ncbi:MAG: hypothetical protein ACLR4Z_08010 [Butyricicoccaceae bacterium]